MNKSRRNFLKTTLSVCLCIIICIVTMGSTPIKTYTAYIDPELKTIISTSKATDLIPVDIWLYEIDTEVVDKEVKAKTGVDLASVQNQKTASSLTNNQIDNYIETERAVYAEFQTTQSEKILNKYSKIFSSKVSTESNSLFVSKYAPFIRIEISPTQIGVLAKDSSVEAIYYSPELQAADDSAISFPVSGAAYARDTLGLYGNGIKIGILEAKGLPERGQFNLTTNRIVFDTSVDRTVFTSHASNVAMLIVGQDYTLNNTNYMGIVPNSTVYATYTCDISGYERNIYECVEWLVQKGVNIINMSMGVYGLQGEYRSLDRWFDHIALQHNIHVIKSAGNRGDDNLYSYISNPGLAYNIITVGNLDINESLELSDDSIYYKSAFNENSNSEKPDIVAPGEYTKTLLENFGGTSAAAPHITGIVAQLCQAEPQLKIYQHAVKAILSASAVTTPHSYTPNDSQYDKYGAGMISAQNAYKTITSNSFLVSNFPANTVGGTTNNHTFTISSAKNRYRIALTWQNYVTIPSSSGHPDYNFNSVDTIADLDLYIEDSNGHQIELSIKSTGNVEIVDISNLPSGTYTIKVKAFEGSTQEIQYSLAWWHSDL